MSAIADALTHQTPTFLIEIDVYDDYQWRIGTSNVFFDDRKFRGLIENDIAFSRKFNFDNLRYSLTSISITASNQPNEDGMRLSDYEALTNVDGRAARLYVWCNGLSWSNISTDGIIYRGLFFKKRHTNKTVQFEIVANNEKVFSFLPRTIISTDTWPDHSTRDSWQHQPMAFGDLDNIPLYCVDTVNYKYIACSHPVKSIDGDYGGSENVYDKDDNIISAANYSMSVDIDGRGNPVVVFDFTSDQTDLEPLSCSIQGIKDGSGDLTGVTDQLIEHPADIVKYVYKYYSDLPDSDLDNDTIGTLRSLLLGTRFGSLIKSETRADDYINRILYQCMAASIHVVGGRIGCMVFDTEADSIKNIDRELHCISRDLYNSKTKSELIANDITFNYKRNYATGVYEKQYRINRFNDKTCEISYYEYGTRKKTIDCPDIHDEINMLRFAARYLAVFSHRHDILENFDMRYSDAFDLNEGDVVNITMPSPEGQSMDGESGWNQEKCILLEKSYSPSFIRCTFWKIRLHMDYGQYSAEQTETPPDTPTTGIKDTKGDAILDTKGDGIPDTKG